MQKVLCNMPGAWLKQRTQQIISGSCKTLHNIPGQVLASGSSTKKRYRYDKHVTHMAQAKGAKTRDVQEFQVITAHNALPSQEMKQ
jgi:hypothetical protein